VRMDEAIAASGGPWLLGPEISLADVAVMPVIVRLSDLSLEDMWRDHPSVGRWLDHIRAHPAYAVTYYFGSLLTERFPHLKEKRAALKA
jgi:glutathione S-transferase